MDITIQILKRTSMQILLGLFLMLRPCFAQDAENKMSELRNKPKEAYDDLTTEELEKLLDYWKDRMQVLDIIIEFRRACLPYDESELMKAFIAHGRENLTIGRKPEARCAFKEAVLNYIYVISNAQESAASGYSWFNEVKEAYVQHGLGEDDEDWQKIKKYIEEVDEKQTLLLENKDNAQDLYTKIRSDLTCPDTCYEEMHAFFSYGKELLKQGKRQEAKLAFLRAIDTRAVADKKAGVKFKGFSLRKLEDFYSRYADVQDDKDLQKIKKYIWAMYGDSWEQAVGGWRVP